MAMLRNVCLDAENHAIKILSELYRMKEDNDHCDFIIEVQNDVYHAHKDIMSAGSEYFRAMLKHDTKERREGRIVFKDVDSECVKSCIDFIYSGKFDIPRKKIQDLLHVAVMMQLDDIKHAISNILAESISAENYFSTRNIADMYGLEKVSSKCEKYFEENIIEIAKQPEFGNISKTDILGFLRLEVLKLNEEEKLTISLQWVEKNPNKKNTFQKCLEIIKLSEISIPVLKRLLETQPMISNDVFLYKLINGHIIEAYENSIRALNEKTIIVFDHDNDCIRAFDPITNKATPFHGEKFKHLKVFTTVYLDPFIYALSQDQSVHRLHFNDKKSKWQKMGNMIHNHGWYPPAVSSSGSIFVIGGSYPEPSDAVEVFNPSINRWLRLDNRPSKISDASLVMLNDSVYCIGGRKHDGEVSTFCRFTPLTSEWVELQPMSYPVCGSGAVTVEQKIIVMGGLRNGQPLALVECYDVASGQWTSLSSMNSCHNWINAYHVENWIFILKQYHSYTYDTEKYDILNDKWYKNSDGDEMFRIFGSTVVKLQNK